MQICSCQRGHHRDGSRRAASALAGAISLLVALVLLPTLGTAEETDPAVEVPASAEPISIEVEAETAGPAQRTTGMESILVEAEIPTGVTQDDAISAVGFGQDDLLLEGISDIRDLSTYTPNLEIKTAFAAVNPTLFIRGVGLDDFNANSASAVSVYQDGVYMNSPAGQLFGLYDIQSVEVLRGPQPTLTNASAGAIIVESRKPTDEFEAFLTSTFGTYNQRDFQGALNVPILPGWIALRSAFNYRKRDGITENLCADDIKRGASANTAQEFGALTGSPVCFQATGRSASGPLPPYFGEPGPTTEFVNDVDNWAARALLSLKMPLPREQEIDWLVNVNGGQNRSLAAQYQHIGLDPTVSRDPFSDLSRFSLGGDPAKDNGNPQYAQDRTLNDPYKGEYDRVGPENLDLLGASLKGVWLPTDSLEFESLTGYFWHDRATFANDDGGPTFYLNDDYTDEGWQINQEARLRWLFGESSEASLGGSYLYETLDLLNVLRSDIRGSILDGEQVFPGTEQVQNIAQETSQWGIYGTLGFEFPAPQAGPFGFLRNFSFDGSVRYNWAEKHFAVDNVALPRIGTVPFQPPNNGEDSDQWSAVTGHAALTYHFTDDKNAYVKWSRGWKPGHFNAGNFSSTQPTTPVDPETVNSIELGLRTLWFDGRLQANLTAFKYDYQDLQVFQLTEDANGRVLRRLINSEEANIQGIEWELSLEPLQGLLLTFNGAYLDSEYVQFRTTFERSDFDRNRDPQRIVVIRDADYSGNRLIASPEWSWAGTVEYTVPLARFGSLRPRFTYAYKDEIFFDANEGFGAEGQLAEQLISQPAYWILNASLTYTSPGGRFEVTGFVRNFLDEAYKVQSFDLSATNQMVIDVYGDPMTAGAILTMRY